MRKCIIDKYVLVIRKSDEFHIFYCCKFAECKNYSPNERPYEPNYKCDKCWKNEDWPVFSDCFLHEAHLSKKRGKRISAYPFWFTTKSAVVCKLVFCCPSVNECCYNIIPCSCSCSICCKCRSYAVLPVF